MAYRGGRPRFTNFRNRKSRQDRQDEDHYMNEAGGSGMSGRKNKVRGCPDFNKGTDEPERKGKHPPHLKGKAIGMFYAQKNQKKKKDEPQQPRKLEGSIKIYLDSSKQTQIRNLLSLQETPEFLSQNSRSMSNPGVQMFESARSSQASSSRKSEYNDNLHRKNSLKVDAESKSNQQDQKSYDHISDSVFKRNFLRSINETLDDKINRLMRSNTAFKQNPSIDQKLKDMLLLKKTSSKTYKAMYEFRKKLPSFQMQDQIMDLINSKQVVVISGETGCGKTTQVAQFILDYHILNERGSLCRVICTQPRRISATSVAERVANERDEELGSISVGYQIRLDKKVAPKQGSILYCTTGVLLQWMQTDPALSETSHVILDEIHERDTVSDFVITLLKDILPKRPDLKLILMSATLNADHFSRYFDSCPSINIPGYAFPVQELYLEDVLEITGFQYPPTRYRYGKKSKSRDFEEFIEPHIRNLQRSRKYSHHTLEALQNPESEEINVDLIYELVRFISATKPEGAILVFLPGWEQISNVNKRITSDHFFSSSRYLIIPLHSMMPSTIQRSVFERPPQGVRKIILATNIAETSITIDDVVYVVDCGKIKIKNYDPVMNVQTLQPEWVSIANARQRRGRAGRVQPGLCYHLYSRAREMTLASYPLPEMLRSRLEEVILHIKILQLGQIRSFLNHVMDPPDSRAIDHSLELLTLMNALDEKENLTPLGYHLAKLPVDPQTGKMLLLGALFSCVDPVFSVAASLGFKDAFMFPLGKEKEVDLKRVELSNGSKSDHLLLGDALMMWEDADRKGRGRQFSNHYFLSESTLRMLRDLKKQFACSLHDMKFLDSSDPSYSSSNLNSTNKSLVKAIVCAGLYPNVAHLRSVKPRVKKFRTPQDGTVFLHPKSVNDKVKFFESPYFVYFLKLKSKSIVLHDTTMVYPLPLVFFGESVRFYVDKHTKKLSVGKYLEFQCDESIAEIIVELRYRLNALLEFRASHPGTIEWRDKTDKHATVLRAIVELITYEDTGLSAQFSQDSDGEDDDSYLDDVLVENVYEDVVYY